MGAESTTAHARAGADEGDAPSYTVDAPHDTRRSEKPETDTLPLTWRGRPSMISGSAGQVAEWLKAPVSKTGVPARVS